MCARIHLHVDFGIFNYISFHSLVEFGAGVLGTKGVVKILDLLIYYTGDRGMLGDEQRFFKTTEDRRKLRIIRYS